MGVKLLKPRVILKDVLDQRVDVLAHGVNLIVYIVQLDFILGNLVVFWHWSFFLILLRLSSTGNLNALLLGAAAHISQA